jgi:hypothetical protein
MSLDRDYVTVPDFAEECGVTLSKVWNWIRYYRYLETEVVLRRPVLKRADCDAFKAEHPELIKGKATAAA